jgi:hypothetical protein
VAEQCVSSWKCMAVSYLSELGRGLKRRMTSQIRTVCLPFQLRGLRGRRVSRRWKRDASGELGCEDAT